MDVAMAAGIPADRVNDDVAERRLYSRDVAPVPAIMSRLFFRTTPQAIVRPGTAEQVAALLREAERARIPVTPRAAASTSYYDAVPARGGLVLDLNDLRGVIGLNSERQTVRVLPATTWFELDDALRLQELAVRSYPSSAVAATVGGWISTQGHGIGSLKYGPLSSQLVALQVALPNGDLRTVRPETDPPLDWFVGAEGTLGVVTEVELAVRPRPAVESHHLYAFDDPASLGQSVVALARSDPRPFTVLFTDAGYQRLLSRAGFSIPSDSPTPPPLLLVSFQGDATEVDHGRENLIRLPGRELPAELAVEEWSLRLYHLRAKRAGPSLLAAEQWLPLERLSAYLEAVAAVALRDHISIGTYGVAVSPDQAMVMSIYPADERRTLEYLAAMGFTKRLHDLGGRFGGRPYGVGLWNSAYLPRLFSRAGLEQLRQRKARLDPHGIMNPGKLYRPPFPLWPAVFGPAAALLAAAYVTMQRRR